jgi:orotate phosphoribosyltransferase
VEDTLRFKKEGIEMTNLFQLGDFHLHSGQKSKYKINCDALTEEDWQTLAMMLVERMHYPFKDVVGVPTGGLKLAEALRQYQDPSAPFTLIVDDVLTTGYSMEEISQKIAIPYIGAVVFAREKVPDWVTPLFTLS